VCTVGRGFAVVPHTRTSAMPKRSAYSATSRTLRCNLTRAPGIRVEDIFIGVVEVARENWWAYARQVNAAGVDDRTDQSQPRS